MRKSLQLMARGLAIVGLLCMVAGLPGELRAQTTTVATDLVDTLNLDQALQYRMIGPYRGGRSTAVAG
ncbi:MAG: hypothetical protein ACE5HV_13030, partial [Acidobacteriota bacterium]